MSKTFRFFLYLLIFYITLNSCYALTKCLLKRFENCHQNDNDAWKLNVTIKTVDTKQYLDGTIVFERSLDNKIRYNTTIEKLFNGKYLHLYSFNGNKSCDDLNKYYGEFLYEFERMGQMIPGICPIQKGKYHWHNALLALEKIPTLPSFPFGTLRFKIDHYDQNSNFYACILIEINLIM